jgi:hypothetical protein
MIGAEDIVGFDCADPAKLTALSGVEVVCALADGRLPRPRWRKHPSFTLLPPSVGQLELHAVPEVRFLNPMGVVHGGRAMIMLDSAMELSAQTLKPDESCPSHKTAVKIHSTNPPVVGPHA